MKTATIGKWTIKQNNNGTVGYWFNGTLMDNQSFHHVDETASEKWQRGVAYLSEEQKQDSVSAGCLTKWFPVACGNLAVGHSTTVTISDKIYSLIRFGSKKYDVAAFAN